MKAILCSLLAASTIALAVDGNRLTYLDESSPFLPTSKTPKFVTPQWIGEPGVEAAVILAIDDMREPAKYEAFLRPILERLKKIDRRAPVSIMTNTVAPDDPQLAAWLREGLALEVHTLTHPCPCLGKASFEEAARTYHECVDLLSSIPGNKPVAFRMPCCDSMNSASPRFFAEIFNRASNQGRWLAIDSSVFMRFSDERFAKYYPAELRPPTKVSLADYAGWIEDYPYPFVIGKLCWEFPCITPSDWQASNAIGPKTQTMLDDWKAALDAVVRAQGVFTAVFHPHGWSTPEQWVEFIDYAERTYGKRVKFLTFREALERLEKNALAGRTLRTSLGPDNGVRLFDVNADGFMDAVIGAPDQPLTRVWDPKSQRWTETKMPANFVRFGDDGAMRTNATLGIMRGVPTIFQGEKSWTFRDGGWRSDDALARGLPAKAQVRFRDLDRDGVCEALTNDGIFAWKDERWQPADFSLPEGCAPFDTRGGDNGLRFVDLNGDGFDDVFQSNDRGHSVYLWAAKVRDDLGWKRGWSHLVRRGTAENIPPFVRDGRDNGAWFHRGHVVWQNEDTVAREAYTLRRSFREIIAFDMPPPKSPADSFAALRPRPGFTVELVAAEPLVESPIAFEWDAQGRLWVVEMRDYPSGMDGKGEPGGRIKILTDDDGDGRYDKATLFADGLPFPTGLHPWRDGVIIAAAPDIFFLRATDGDDESDERTVLFTGFKEGNQQHRMNGFEWGLDGWIYGANGDSGGRIVAKNRTSRPLSGLPLSRTPPPRSAATNISGRDFRFRPDTGEFEAESGQTQYGRRRDDWGHWFGNNNPTWLWHYTLEDRYLRRNSRLAVKATKQMLANYTDSTRVFTAYDENSAPIRFNQPQSLGHVTSANSPTPYRDELFGPEFATSVFISEPVHNVVHREVLEPDGATFTSKRAADEQDREFLASTDPWFRPTMLKTGPDGALYVADMYRFVLEHPEWIAPETQARLDLRAGSDKGRIYRVFPTGARLRPIPNLAKLDNVALASALDSPNGWQRDIVQRLLFERQARDAAPVLRKLVASANGPKVRLQALATLDVLGLVDVETVRAAIRDAHPAVRAHALRVSESLPAFEPALLACQDDPEFAVRRQLAFTLGTWRDARAQAALAHLVERDGEHEQMRVAILSSLPPESALFAKLNAVPAGANAPVPPLPKPTTTDRAKVIARYAQVGELKGDAAHGRTLLQQQCAICHRFKGEGQELGPDLGMVAAKPLDWLLAALFDPNAAIEPRYQAQILKLKSGAEFTGLVVAETTNNLTLRLPGGTEQAVLRSDLAEQKAGRSLMPEGLEGALQPQDVADLIAALRAP